MYISITTQITESILWKCLSYQKLSYHCCTGRTLRHLQKCLWCVLVNFTSSIILLYYLSPHSWNSFNRPHFFVFICEYIIFPPYSLSFTFSFYTPLFYWYLARQDLFYLLVLHFQRKDSFLCLRYLYREFHYDISMNICIVSWMGLFTPFFSFLP
jgi:hypothetical protein